MPGGVVPSRLAQVMTLPKYAQVAESIRAQIAEGTLKPGQPAPSGAPLARATGYSTLTCRRALRTLIKDGTAREWILIVPTKAMRPMTDPMHDLATVVDSTNPQRCRDLP